MSRDDRVGRPSATKIAAEKKKVAECVVAECGAGPGARRATATTTPKPLTLPGRPRSSRARVILQKGNGSDPFPPGFGQGDALASFPPPPPRVQAASAWNATQHRPSGTAAAVQSVAQQHSPQQTSGTIAAMLLSSSSAWNTLQSITTPARTAAQGFVRTAILQVRNAARDLATPGRELKHDVPEPEWYGRMSDSIISATTDASRFPVVQ